MPSNQVPAEPDLSRRAFVVALVVLVVLGLGTRFYKLSTWSYYGDEFFTLEEIGDSRTGVAPTMWQCGYPLGYGANWLSEKVLGENEFASRFPSALFGAAAPAVLCLLAGRVMRRRAAVLVGLLILVQPWHLFKSQWARYYTLGFLLGGAGALLLYETMERDSWKRALLSSVLIIACIASHVTGIFVFGAVVLYVLAVRVLARERPRGLNARTLLAFFAPFAILAVLGIAAKLGGGFLRTLSAFGKDYGQTESGGYSPMQMIIRLAPSLAVFAGLPALLLPLLAMFDGLRRRERLGLFFACTFLGTLACGFIYCFMHPVERRYLFIPMSLWLVAAGYGLDRLLPAGENRWRRWPMSAAVLLLVLGYYAPDLAFHYRDGARPNIRAALHAVADRASPGDLVVSNCIIGSSLRIYGDRSAALEFFRLSTVQLTTWKAEELSRHTSDARRTWYVLEYRRPGLPPEWVKWLWRNCVCVADLRQPRYGYMEWNLGVFVHDPAWRAAAQERHEPRRPPVGGPGNTGG